MVLKDRAQVWHRFNRRSVAASADVGLIKNHFYILQAAWEIYQHHRLQWGSCHAELAPRTAQVPKTPESDIVLACLYGLTTVWCEAFLAIQELTVSDLSSDDARRESVRIFRQALDLEPAAMVWPIDCPEHPDLQQAALMAFSGWLRSQIRTKGRPKLERALSRTGSVEVALESELPAEAFLAWRDWDPATGTRWLVAKTSKALEQGEKDKPPASLPDDYGRVYMQPSAEEQFIARELAAAQSNSIPSKRLAIMRLAADGYKYREIAEMLGIQEGTVKAHVAAARKAARAAG